MVSKNRGGARASEGLWVPELLVSVLTAGCGAGDAAELFEEQGTANQGVTKAVDPTASGDIDFCSATGAPCTSGEGDCDSNAECVPGLVCATNNGQKFGMGGIWDVCVPAHCTDGVLTVGTDETGIDCSTSDSDCDLCVTCPDETANGAVDFCTVACPCSTGQGDCDANYQCETGLVCGTDNGQKFGMGGIWDVCVPAHCADGALTAGTDETGIDCSTSDSDSDCGLCVTCPDEAADGAVDFCSVACPCSTGRGDCDADCQCEPGLVVSFRQACVTVGGAPG